VDGLKKKMVQTKEEKMRKELHVLRRHKTQLLSRVAKKDWAVRNMKLHLEKIKREIEFALKHPWSQNRKNI